jgi:1,4-dihydroxy-2-naphthoyl-CoA synthase
MAYKHILFEKKGGVAWITFNHPERHNSFDHATISEYGDALWAAHGDGNIGVVVVTGAGTQAFCAGGYLADLQNFSTEKGRKLFDAATNALTAMRRIRQPVIASVNGFAIGGGNEIVICACLAIASENAKFGQVGPKIGSSPVIGGTNMLALTIGEKKAREVVYFCKQYSAAEALELGWINKVVPQDKLKEETQAWCETLLDRSPSYLEISKISSNVWFDSITPSLEHGKHLIMRMAGSPEMTEGATAFMNKRKPDFRRFRRNED